MSENPAIHDNIIYKEMMSHPALFSHLRPQVIGIIGDQENQILQEVLKHKLLTSIWQIQRDKIDHAIEDQRVIFHDKDPIDADFFDILIIAEEFLSEKMTHYFNILNPDGILIHQSHSPFQIKALKSAHKNLHSAGFQDILTLHFPQPSLPLGSRTAFMAKKKGVFRKPKEKEIFNRPFQTIYYNFDIHKASLAMPEFMRNELHGV